MFMYKFNGLKRILNIKFIIQKVKYKMTLWESHIDVDIITNKRYI